MRDRYLPKTMALFLKRLRSAITGLVTGETAEPGKRAGSSETDNEGVTWRYAEDGSLAHFILPSSARVNAVDEAAFVRSMSDGAQLWLYNMTYSAVTTREPNWRYKVIWSSSKRVR